VVKEPRLLGNSQRARRCPWIKELSKRKQQGENDVYRFDHGRKSCLCVDMPGRTGSLRNRALKRRIFGYTAGGNPGGAKAAASKTSCTGEMGGGKIEIRRDHPGCPVRLAWKPPLRN